MKKNNIKNENEVRKLFGKYFNIIEVGYFDNYYCGVGGHHGVVLLES